MPRTRLFAVAMLALVYSGTGLAQSQSGRDSLVRSQDTQSTDSSSIAGDQLVPILNLQLESGMESASEVDPAENMRIGQYSAPKNELFDFPNAGRMLRGTDLGMDGICFTIRNYRVVRDDPHSDSVHRDGYSTCMPAARVHMYSAAERGR